MQTGTDGLEEEANDNMVSSPMNSGVSSPTSAEPNLSSSLCRKRRRPGGRIDLKTGTGGNTGGAAGGESSSSSLPSSSLSRSRSLPVLADLRQRSHSHTQEHELSPAVDADDMPVAGEYASNMLQTMNSLRDQGALCDVVVRGDKLAIKAHRVVLAAASEYFRACLLGPMQESSDKVIHLSGMDDGALKELVSYAYCGRVRLAEDTVLEILVAANRLQVPQVVEQCCDFLIRRMDSSNCLTILGIANMFHCAHMRIKAEAYLHRHFESVYLGEEFLQMPLDKLVQLLSNDSVSVTSEETIFNAAVRWISADADTRRGHMLALLRTVRLQLVPTFFIADVIHQHDLVQCCPEAERLLLQAYHWHNSALQDLREQAYRYVRGRAIRPVIYVIGGDDGHDDRNPYSDVISLNTHLSAWRKVSPLQQKRSVCGAATLRGKMYVVGGYDGERAVETVEEFDPTTNTWRYVANLSQRRCSCGCAVIDGLLYAVGGVCGPLALNEVERYDPVTDQWTLVPAMQDGRSGCGVAELGGLLYAVGGINCNGDTVCTAECFDPSTQRWQSVQSMHETRRSFGLAALGGLLYACGGNDGVNDLNTLEVYNPLTNRWKVLVPMRHARMYCSVVVLDEKLYAVGGLDGTTSLNVVEVFDPSRGVWEEILPKLDHHVCGCGLAVMDCVAPEKELDVKEKIKSIGGYADQNNLSGAMTVESASDEAVISVNNG